MTALRTHTGTQRITGETTTGLWRWLLRVRQELWISRGDRQCQSSSCGRRDGTDNGKAVPRKEPLLGTRSNGPREQAETHATLDFLPLSIVEDVCLKKAAACAGCREVTRNFESVLVIDNAPIRLLGATVAAPSCEFPERFDWLIE